MLRHLKIFLWRLLAVAALLMGLLGIILPGLPTVVFLLISAWAAGHGWPPLEAWLLAHPRYGPHIRQWREHRSVPRRAKWMASGMMLLSCVVVWVTDTPVWVQWGLPPFLACIALWLWTRPETGSPRSPPS